MRKFLSFLILIGFLTLPGIGLAQETADDVIRIFERIANWLFSFLLIAAVIMIVVAGFLFVTAGGKPEQITKARNIIIYALIGVVVAVLARGLVDLIQIMIQV